MQMQIAANIHENIGRVFPSYPKIETFKISKSLLFFNKSNIFLAVKEKICVTKDVINPTTIALSIKIIFDFNSLKTSLVINK